MSVTGRRSSYLVASRDPRIGGRESGSAGPWSWTPCLPRRELGAGDGGSQVGCRGLGGVADDRAVDVDPHRAVGRGLSRLTPVSRSGRVAARLKTWFSSIWRVFSPALTALGGPPGRWAAPASHPRLRRGPAGRAPPWRLEIPSGMTCCYAAHTKPTQLRIPGRIKTRTTRTKRYVRHPTARLLT